MVEMLLHGANVDAVLPTDASMATLLSLDADHGA